MKLGGRDVITIGDLSQEEIMTILRRAREFVPVAEGKEKVRALEGRIMASLFFEPSTRTRLSFEAAMLRLGGGVVGFDSPEGSSIAKGETLADTVRMAESYCDGIVLRHPQEGAARLAAEFSRRPVINAGDGVGQHPTQTLLDLYTIWENKGRIEGNTVVLVGDLKYGRTVHSLAHALALFGADLWFVAPPTLEMPKEVVDHIVELGAKPRQTADLQEVMGEADVLYVTRIQKERFPDPQEYAKVVGSYRIDVPLLREAKREMVVMHPLPRVNEIAPDVDRTPHALYFRQAFNGVPVRMALLFLILGEAA